MTEPGATLPAGARVHHEGHGGGRVVADMGDTVLARFGDRIESTLRRDLRVETTVESTIASGLVGDGRDALLRAQALAIRSVNDQWGVFSRSRVQLLPHQLWVCHRVNGQWPFRWLVADDVGLGKTIECGLVLMPLIASGRIKRLLVLAPAKLVPQWQERMRQMFDIRLQAYAKDVDTDRLDFWGTANMVVASIHTLRDDRRKAKARLLDAEPWDAVVVDEAHHLNADERLGDTLAYSLLREMEVRRRIGSLLFFSGTPHRGKDFGFLALMRLVRPDLFDPDREAAPQMANLSRAMIRNNKSMATDLQGNRLFTEVAVSSREYVFGEMEQRFYETLSSFIIDGRAYAATFDGRAQSGRMLLLITLQKLAASSIAAIRNALVRRRDRLSLMSGRAHAETIVVPSDDDDDLDASAERDEALTTTILTRLTDDEIERLDELIALSDAIVIETKVAALVDLIQRELPPGEPVLLFTEYKATQALVVNALQKRFGYFSATFINGDERLDGIVGEGGTVGTRRWPRSAAADAFNDGERRFLVSTEAAGEGIDLQRRCATLIHVDMPWNPMRLHQRVGRLSRYGQKRPVAVYILRNPETVEARIWGLLNAKLERIQHALGSVMEEGEDISQLVVGMTGGNFFDNLFAGAQVIPKGQRLDEWFDKASATLGGEGIVERVKSMLGNVSRFDFQQVGRDLPQVDLPDLERFFTGVIARHGRRVFKRDDGLEVKSPDEWVREDYALSDRYDGLTFDRATSGPRAASRVVGVGHRLFDRALREAEGFAGKIGYLCGLDGPLLIAAIEDEVTGTGAQVGKIVLGIYDRPGGATVLRDWELLQVLNGMTRGEEPRNVVAADAGRHVDRLMAFAQAALAEQAPLMTRPKAWAEMLILPERCNSKFP